MDNQKDIFINKKLNIQRKYIVKKNINNIDILDDSKGKIKVLDFEGHTKINKIISPSLKELHNYTGIIDDKLISNCPNLTTIYLNKLSEIDLSYNNKIKKVYFYYNGRYICLYKYDKNNVLTGIIVRLFNIYITVENDFEKNKYNYWDYLDYYEAKAIKTLKKVNKSMIKNNILYIPEKYQSIDIDNLDEYNIDTFVINNELHILGNEDQYKNINNIEFNNIYNFYDSTFKCLINLQNISIFDNDIQLKIQIPHGYKLIDHLVYKKLYFSNGNNAICYDINHIYEKQITKTIFLYDNSEYYNEEANTVEIPDDYDHVIIDFNHINSVNLCIKNCENIPSIHFKNHIILNKLFIKCEEINTLDGIYDIDIFNNVKYIEMIDKDYVLKCIFEDYVINSINMNYKIIKRRPSIITDYTLIKYDDRKIKKLLK